MTGIAPSYVVILVGIYLCVELYSGFDESCRILQRIEVMDIVVGRARNEQQAPFQIRRMGNGSRLFVAVAVFFGGAHEPFGVNGVVVSPVGYGGNGYPGTIDSVAGRHGHECFVSAVAPPVYAYAGAIYIR